MTTDNKQFIEKADMLIADLNAAGGLMPEQADKFLRIAVESSRFLSLVYIDSMKNQKKYIETASLADRVFHKATSATALGVGKRSAPVLGRVELDSKELIAQIDLPYDVVEDNIERGSFQATVLDLLGKKAGSNTAMYAIQADTASADDDLNIFDGIIVQAVSHGTDKADAYVDAELLNKMVLSLPGKYREDVSQLAFLVSPSTEQRYRHSMGERATPYGDTSRTEFRPMQYCGINVMPIAQIPENVGTSSHCSVAFLCDPKNIHIGYHRTITIESMKDIKARVYSTVATLRMDVKFAVEDAVAYAYNIKV